MSRESPFEIHPLMIRCWQEEIDRANPERLAELTDLCSLQCRSWMAGARNTKRVGVRPWLEVGMAWKYHRHLLLLRRAVRRGTPVTYTVPRLTQLALL